ncbi:MAG: LamG-like jellyroll fold domain-containing protein [Verrucomicrobiota bacterium]
MKPDSSSFDQDQLLAWIADVLDGTLEQEERDAMNALLREHAEARGLYREHMELHARLHLDYAGGSTQTRMPGLASMPGNESPTNVIGKIAELPKWWLGIAAALVAALLFNGLILGLRSGGEQIVDASNPVDGVAVLSHAVAAVWDEDGASHREGDALPKGQFELTAGLAQIEFFGGATVILEGPAALELISPRRARFLHGRLRASVPEPAQGFTIEAPDFDAVDLGTEFAMSLDADGRSELHVVDGEVALHQKSGSHLQTLTTGLGIRSSGMNEIESIAENGGGFVNREQMARLTNEGWRERASTWQESQARWKEDPDTVVYFDFEDHQPWDRQLRNAKKDAPGGAVVGAQWTQGRWPGKGSLEFKRINDRVRLQIPGEFDSLTFSSWVRIEGFDRWLSSLILTDGWGLGEPHWQISDKGELILGIGGLGNSFSPPVIGPESLGRWLHLATVFDHRTAKVTHFVDGQLVAETSYPKSIPLRIGTAEIGNWRSEDRMDSNAIRSLNGRMDEFLILQRALSPSEIRQLYTNGSPNL